MERPYRRPVLRPREVRTSHHPGGGADPAGARAHTHAKDTRGLPEGQPDRARGTHRPRGMAYQRARVRDTRTGTACHTQRGTRGAGRGKRERHNTGYGPEPPEPAASAAHTRTGHCTRQASAPAQGGPTGDKPVAQAWQRRRPGRPRIRGATRWVSARSHGCELMN